MSQNIVPSTIDNKFKNQPTRDIDQIMSDSRDIFSEERSKKKYLKKSTERLKYLKEDLGL